MTTFSLARQIYEEGIDFDFVDDSLLSQTVMRDGTLEIAGIQFRAVLLPPMTTIRRQTLTKLQEGLTLLLLACVQPPGQPLQAHAALLDPSTTPVRDRAAVIRDGQVRLEAPVADVSQVALCAWNRRQASTPARPSASLFASNALTLRCRWATGASTRWRVTPAAMNDLAALAAAENVVLLFEPHVESVLESPFDTLTFLQRSPALKIMLDYSHFVAQGDQPADVAPLVPYAGHVHLRQACRDKLQARWNDGIIDFPAVVELLKAAGYNSYLTLEYEHNP